MDDNYLFYSSIADQVTQKWRQNKRLPYRTPVFGYILYDQIIYCKAFSSSEFGFHYCDSRASSTIGHEISKAEVIRSIWNELSDRDKRIIMADVLGNHA